MWLTFLLWVAVLASVGLCPIVDVLWYSKMKSLMDHLCAVP